MSRYLNMPIMDVPIFKYANVDVPIFKNRDIHLDRKSTRLNSSHVAISYAVVCVKKKTDGLREHGQGEGKAEGDAVECARALRQTQAEDGHQRGEGAQRGVGQRQAVVDQRVGTRY